MQVTAEDIKVVSRLVDDLCGIVLDETKGYLIKSRLTDVAKAAGCNTFSELYYKARYDTASDLRDKIIDAITTNETLFFRDTSPYEALQHKALPELIDSKAKSAFPKRIRIWSAACSTGQEPYSIAMVLFELLGDVYSWDVTITATDISDAAVRQASRGVFGANEIQRGMRSDLLPKYFTQVPEGWKVKDELRGLVTFQRFNLHHPFTPLGTFDIVFCRNVAIYFSPAARADLFNRIAASMNTNGYLFVGSSESLGDLGKPFTPQHHCRSVFYQPTKATVASAT